MSDVDFQNGFACGMATKGLVRSGELYKPVCWNDSGHYSYFYIDFRRSMTPFSLGMFNESMLVADTNQLPVTAIVYVSLGVYKVTCDISACLHGVTILNKATSFLSFASGERLPVFSTAFDLTGMTQYTRVNYMYDQVSFPDFLDIDAVEHTSELALTDWAEMDGISEIVGTFPHLFSSTSENFTFTLN